MKTHLFAVLFLFAAVSFALFPSCASSKAVGPGAGATANAMVYVCDCPGESTKCDHVKTAAGKCGCGRDLTAHHVVAIEGSSAKVCSCGGGCACKVSSDPTKCTCGKPLQTVSLAGKGLYTCTCGGGCGCSLVMPGPGKCGCGKDLVPIK